MQKNKKETSEVVMVETTKNNSPTQQQDCSSQRINEVNLELL